MLIGRWLKEERNGTAHGITTRERAFCSSASSGKAVGGAGDGSCDASFKKGRETQRRGAVTFQDQLLSRPAVRRRRPAASAALASARAESNCTSRSSSASRGTKAARL